MAQGRMLLKQTSDSQDVARLYEEATKRFGEGHGGNAVALFLMCIPHLDCEGRMRGSPKVIAGQVVPLLPIESSMIRDYLRVMDELGLVVWYVADGQEYLAFPGFARSQKINKDREAPSRVPSPDKGRRVCPRAAQEPQASLALEPLLSSSGATQESPRTGTGAPPDELQNNAGVAPPAFSDKLREDQEKENGKGSVSRAGARGDGWGGGAFEVLFREVTRRPTGDAQDSVAAARQLAELAGEQTPPEEPEAFARRALGAFVEVLEDARRRGKHHGEPSVYEFIRPIGETQTTGLAKALGWLEGRRPAPPANGAAHRGGSGGGTKVTTGERRF